jgi:hypothetical protein
MAKNGTIDLKELKDILLLTGEKDLGRAKEMLSKLVDDDDLAHGDAVLGDESSEFHPKNRYAYEAGAAWVLAANQWLKAENLPSELQGTMARAAIATALTLTVRDEE